MERKGAWEIKLLVFTHLQMKRLYKSFASL